MIEIYFRRGDGTKELSPIDDGLINSAAMAQRRGIHEIDRQWYLVHSIALGVPHKKTDASGALLDGDIIDLSHSLFGLTGNHLVRQVVISGSPRHVENTITVESFEDFE